MHKHAPHVQYGYHIRTNKLHRQWTALAYETTNDDTTFLCIAELALVLPATQHYIFAVPYMPFMINCGY